MRIADFNQLKMKTIALSLCFVVCFCNAKGQSKKPVDQIIEGGKVVVELIKAIRGKKDLEKGLDCQCKCSDFCITNEGPFSISASLQHRSTKEKRELVILPHMRECCLQVEVGVWTYDLQMTGSSQSIRKGDILIEGCQNLHMTITY